MAAALAPLAAAGSAAGATLLLFTPAEVFDRGVPFLLAFAALALLFQPRVSAWLAGHSAGGSRLLLPGGLIAVSAYDGYWGAGAGVMTLALLTITIEQSPDSVSPSACGPEASSRKDGETHQP
jgi:uncharacterized protein